MTIDADFVVKVMMGAAIAAVYFVNNRKAQSANDKAVAHDAPIAELKTKADDHDAQLKVLTPPITPGPDMVCRYQPRPRKVKVSK